MNEKVAIVLTWDGFQDQEVIYPFYRFQEEGYTVSVRGPDQPYVTGISGTRFSCDGPPESVPDLLILPGGVKAIEKIRQDTRVIQYIRLCMARGIPIASICHGSQLLISAKVIRGMNISGYYSIQDDIENAGAIYSRDPIVCGNISSAAHYKDMPVWIKNTLHMIISRS